MRADRLTDRITHHGEGPVWSSAWGGLRIVDLDAGALVTLTDAGAQRLDIGGPIAAFHRPRVGGGYVAATERGIALSDDVHAPPSRRIDLWDDPTVRMNDGGADPLGRLYAGSMAYDEGEGRASLRLIDTDLESRIVLDNVTVSNGLGFSPDASLCYYIDTATGRVDVFDHVDGDLRDRRPFATIADDVGHPDGLTVAADGSVWVALWNGSGVRGFSADGELVSVIDVDARQVSACTFGGDDLGELFITTSRQGMDPEDDPAAGSVFSLRPGAVGLPVLPFGG